ncbi:MAG: type IV pilin protein [Gammaproteobacteria bacterium]
MIRQRPLSPACRRAFSLPELLAVIAILGILVTIGYPAYTEQLRQSRRAEGMGALLELAARLEGFYADHGTYLGATLGHGAGAVFPASTVNGYYTLGIDAQSATGYTVSATPTRRSGQHRDRCGSFMLTSLGVRSVSNAAYYSRCWR